MINSAACSDIINSEAYGSPAPNTLTLILFVDGSSFRKTPAGSFWLMCSMIAELPPLIRMSYNNIVTHFIYGSSSPNFESYLPKHSTELENLLNSGIIVDGVKYSIRILGLIADAPARAKVTFTIQFNGAHGCLQCLNEGVLLRKGLRVYEFIPATERTNEMYMMHIGVVRSTQETY